MHRFFESHEAVVAHEVHAAFWGGTHGLKLDVVTTMTISKVCPMCETVFPNLVTARILAVQAFRNGRCFVKRSARACEREEKVETEAPFACPNLECSSLFPEMGLLRRHNKYAHSNTRGLPDTRKYMPILSTLKSKKR